MNLTIKPLTEATAADFFDFFDNRAFSDGSPYAPCYCNCFQLTPDHVRMHIGERASALGGGFEGLRLALRESAENLIKEKTLQGYLAYENDLSIGWCNANSSLDFNGPVKMYQNAGFEEIKRHGKTIIMQKRL